MVKGKGYSMCYSMWLGYLVKIVSFSREKRLTMRDFLLDSGTPSPPPKHVIRLFLRKKSKINDVLKDFWDLIPRDLN